MFGRVSNTRDRPVCQFYLEGRCRFGDNCKNEHPRNQGGQNGNRFAALDSQQRGRNGGFNSGQASQDRSRHLIEADNIKNDFTTDRPMWPFSSYGPGKNPPRDLISSESEQSPEEMRLLHYQGNAQETAQREANMMQTMDNTVQKILNDLPAAVKYIMDGFDQHPNRIDQAEGRDQAQSAPSTAFGQTPNPLSTNATQSAFGQPSSFGRPSAFGQPSSLGQSSNFGQPSQPGNAGQTSTFGQPSQPGGAGFGQASQPSGFARAGQPAFGQSGFGGGGGGITQGSTFGQPSAPQSTFGQPTPPKSAFGQPSAFGNTGQQQSSFGQPSAFGAAAPQQSAFGQPSAFGAAAAKTSPFASATQAPQTSTFGAPSAFGAAAAGPSPFAAAAPAKANPFGTNGHAQPSSTNPFGSTTNQPSAFGQPSQPSAFGQPSQPSTFGQPSQPAVSDASSTTLPPHTTANASGQITSFKGRPVTQTAQNPPTYVSRNPQTGKDERIWFPAGEPKATSDVVAPEACYQGEQGQRLEQIYKYVQQNGVFENGIMPEIPPQRAWISFDI